MRWILVAGFVASRLEAAPMCGKETCSPGEVCCTNHCCSKKEACLSDGKLWCGTAYVGHCYDAKTDPTHCGACNTQCASLCSNGACAPVSVQVIRTSLSPLDLNVAASAQHVLASANVASAFELRQRPSPFPLATDPLLSGNGRRNLFRALLIDPGALNVNNQLVGASPVPCVTNTAGEYIETSTCDTWPAGVSPCKDPGRCPSATDSTHRDHNPLPTSACVTSLYDNQVLYDALRRRFWIISHARSTALGNPPCDHSVSSSTAQAWCNQLANEWRRIVMLAVSKTADPKDGFWTYAAVSGDTDMPFLAVDGIYTIFYNHVFQPGGALACRKDENPSSWETPLPAVPAFRVFDAGALAHPAGVPPVPSQATPGNAAAAELAVTNTHDGKRVMPGTDIHGVALRVAKHHDGAPRTTFIVSFTYGDAGTDVWIYALSAPHQPGQTQLLGPAHYLSSQKAIFETVYSAGKLYVAGGRGNQVVLERLPISPDDVTAKKEIPASAITTATLTRDAETVDFVTMDVTKQQDAVVSYMAYNVGITPNLVRYAILRHDANHFNASPAVEDAAFLSGPKSSQPIRVDFVGSQRDILDPGAVWSIHADRDGVLLTLIRP